LGHAVFVTNTPYVIHHYEVAPANSFYDGYLDVLFFADLSKLDLIGYVLKGPGTGNSEDSRIQHYRVKKIEIETTPHMPVMADGIELGEGTASIAIQCNAISIIVGKESK
jgi:diacylglycerol kinase family enzyme